MAVATGSAKYVVVYRALNGRSGARYSEGVSGGATTSDLIHWSWYMPSGLMTPASWVAMFSQRYMYETGCSSEDLGQGLCVGQRKHAVKNPAAFFYEKPLSIEDHQNARKIVDPLRLYRLLPGNRWRHSLHRDNPGARSRPRLPSGAALIRSVAQAAGADQEVMTSFYRPSLATLPEMDLVAKQNYAMSWTLTCRGHRRGDPLRRILDHHACGSSRASASARPGEAKDFIQDGALELGGRLPTNTHGGQLSEAYIHGMNGVNEGVRLDPRDIFAQPAREERPRACDRWASAFLPAA